MSMSCGYSGAMLRITVSPASLPPYLQRRAEWRNSWHLPFSLSACCGWCHATIMSSGAGGSVSGMTSLLGRERACDDPRCGGLEDAGSVYERLPGRMSLGARR